METQAMKGGSVVSAALGPHQNPRPILNRSIYSRPLLHILRPSRYRLRSSRRVPSLHRASVSSLPLGSGLTQLF